MSCSAEDKQKQSCPICYKLFAMSKIEAHANRCIFLNSTSETPTSKKRTPSPTFGLELGSKKKSPRLSNSNVNRQSLGSKSSGQSSSLNLSGQCSSLNLDVQFGGNNKLTGEPSSNLKAPPENNFQNFTVPLAKQVAPKSLDEFFGQKHVLGRDTVLRSLLEKGDIPNIILWGPPGCGKTSLAGVIHQICRANPNKYRFVSFCAANCGVKDVQNVVGAAKLDQKFGRRTVLFMDEVHRFNKKQQDTFLSHVEKGDITLLGATTENPSFSINSALLSRCRVVVLEKLQTEDLVSILIRAASSMNVHVTEDEDEDYSESLPQKTVIEKSALTWLAETSDGDARIALGSLQLVFQFYNTVEAEPKVIDVERIKNGIKKSHMLYDRKGEEHYNTISAMHKSIRGSDPNAALYWTTRMIVSGEDPLFIARRMVRAASEDIGNADPQALQLAVSTMQGCQLLGMPEADVLLAQCAIYLARAPKSREADSALAAAKRTISECKGAQPDVPMHIRNAPTKLMKELGYGRLAKGATRSFMPVGLEDVNFF